MIAKLNKRSTEPIISLESAKEHLRILNNNQDFYIHTLLDVVTTSIENELERDLVDTEYSLHIYSKINVNEEIYFPNSPVYNVIQVVFKDSSGTEITEGISYVNSDEYIKFTELPEDYNSIVITYKKGFSNAEDIPEPIKHASKLMLSDLFNFRGTIVLGKSVFNLDKTIQRLLQPYRNVKFL
ncbi:head-tail connector protein [Arthrospiribacter ruber]|uniref:Phage head-tail connector protein n=1 Tax=Arthrospiribacter ruber TaxID=2487934 RepID=A0A951J055_9BACT|nr:phage head-tail connector protein [Arthrospiribacter ruber]MBW3469081.1 phage head-tail connector protein [Arthrospiribacter ruber]